MKVHTWSYGGQTATGFSWPHILCLDLSLPPEVTFSLVWLATHVPFVLPTMTAQLSQDTTEMTTLFLSNILTSIKQSFKSSSTLYEPPSSTKRKNPCQIFYMKKCPCPSFITPAVEGETRSWVVTLQRMRGTSWGHERNHIGSGIWKSELH